MGLLGAGVLVVVVSCAGMLVVRGIFARLHFISPVTSFGGPLIAASLVVRNGWGLTSGAVLLIAGLLGLTGPALAAATARLAAQRRGITERGSAQ